MEKENNDRKRQPHIDRQGATVPPELRWRVARQPLWTAWQVMWAATPCCVHTAQADRFCSCAQSNQSQLLPTCRFFLFFFLLVFSSHMPRAFSRLASLLESRQIERPPKQNGRSEARRRSMKAGWGPGNAGAADGPAGRACAPGKGGKMGNGGKGMGSQIQDTNARQLTYMQNSYLHKWWEAQSETVSGPPSSTGPHRRRKPFRSCSKDGGHWRSRAFDVPSGRGK